jgi:hypothetical protein
MRSARPRTLWLSLAALVIALLLGAVNAREEGFEARGSQVDVGSALENGAVAFATAAVFLTFTVILLKD